MAYFDISVLKRPLINDMGIEMIHFTGIHHHSILVADIAISIDFYQSVLGLSVDMSRPSILPYKGAWFVVGEQAIHALELPNPDAGVKRPEHGGRDRHVALMCHSIDSLIEQLLSNNISFTRSKSGRKAVFFRDPDQNAIEAIEV